MKTKDCIHLINTGVIQFKVLTTLPIPSPRIQRFLGELLKILDDSSVQILSREPSENF